MEDAFYRVTEEPHSSIIVSGVVYDFEKHGHNFVILDALTGKKQDGGLCWRSLEQT